MTSYLAPESPRPFSIAAEHYFQTLNFRTGLPIVTNERIFRVSKCPFGEQYEREFCFYLAKHAEVNCNDRICLVGEESDWALIVQERLFLIKPVHFIDCKLHQGAIKEQLTANAFDRIILLNCLHQISNSSTNDDVQTESQRTNASSNSSVMSYINILRKSLAKDGKLIITHREPNINTLPLPVEVISSWYNADTHSARLIEQLHRERKRGLELLWEVETIKFSLQKLNWFNLLIHRTFYPLTLNNQKQIADGLRQLNETYFKYHQGFLEMYDRLLFLTVQNQTEPSPTTKIVLPKLIQSSTNQINSTNSFSASQGSGRLRRKPIPSQTGPHEIWDYKMLVTDEVRQLLDLNQNRMDKKQNLFKSSIDFM
ncbi:unnamed protein product [Rotaria socialis]|uniref:Uncharacterized protein n=4 Tax=Rotaria socialis TaxID=392032 RepID=A0A818RXI1_9BILA|nr:unnamed protein product [Rotaria socialis]CAF4565233.1 unnamed protein product [Rotaria socialis]